MKKRLKFYIKKYFISNNETYFLQLFLNTHLLNLNSLKHLLKIFKLIISYNNFFSKIFKIIGINV